MPTSTGQTCTRRESTHGGRVAPAGHAYLTFLKLCNNEFMETEFPEMFACTCFCIEMKAVSTVI